MSGLRQVRLGFLEWVSAEFFLKYCNQPAFVLPQEGKDRERSGDLAVHWIPPCRPIHWLGKVSFKYRPLNTQSWYRSELVYHLVGTKNLIRVKRVQTRYDLLLKRFQRMSDVRFPWWKKVQSHYYPTLVEMSVRSTRRCSVSTLDISGVLFYKKD